MQSINNKFIYNSSILAYYISKKLKNFIHKNTLWLNLLTTYYLNCTLDLKQNKMNDLHGYQRISQYTSNFAKYLPETLNTFLQQKSADKNKTAKPIAYHQAKSKRSAP